jgi:DNA polymerase-3 subunit beta
MKLTITKDNLSHGLAAVQNVVSNRTTLPILSNVLLRAKDGRLELTATDLDVTISCGVAAEVAKAGETTIPVRKLASIVRELGVGELQLETDDKNFTTISAGSSFYKIHGLAAEEFPPLPKFKENKQITLPQEKLKGMLKKTSFAISTDETRYVLNGILFSFKDNKLTLVATDGRRLALVDIELEFPRTHETEIIVPTKAVNELQRLLAEDGDVKISVTENQVAFELNGALILSKLIEGTYPNYRQVIPGEAKERIPLERDLFLNAVHRVSLLASEKSNSVKLIFTKNNLDIMANTPEVGEAKESVSVNYRGKDISLAFNPEFLMAPLRNLTEDEVFLDLIDEMSPGVLKVHAAFLYVLMPMRIS